MIPPAEAGASFCAALETEPKPVDGSIGLIYRIGLAPGTSQTHIIFYYGLLSLPPPLAISGDELDEHFQFPVREAVEVVNAYFVTRLSALIEQED